MWCRVAKRVEGERRDVGSREGDELLQGREWVAEGAVAGGRGVVGKEEGGVRVWEGGAKSLRVD